MFGLLKPPIANFWWTGMLEMKLTKLMKLLELLELLVIPVMLKMLKILEALESSLELELELRERSRFGRLQPRNRKVRARPKDLDPAGHRD